LVDSCRITRTTASPASSIDRVARVPPASASPRFTFVDYGGIQRFRGFSHLLSLRRGTGHYPPSRQNSRHGAFQELRGEHSVKPQYRCQSLGRTHAHLGRVPCSRRNFSNSAAFRPSGMYPKSTTQPIGRTMFLDGCFQRSYKSNNAVSSSFSRSYTRRIVLQTPMVKQFGWLSISGSSEATLSSLNVSQATSPPCPNHSMTARSAPLLWPARWAKFCSRWLGR